MSLRMSPSTTHRRGDWLTGHCATECIKLQLKALPSLLLFYCDGQTKVEKVDDEFNFTRHTCELHLCRFTTGALCGAMRLWLNRSQARQNILIQSSVLALVEGIKSSHDMKKLCCNIPFFCTIILIAKGLCCVCRLTCELRVSIKTCHGQF